MSHSSCCIVQQHKICIFHRNKACTSQHLQLGSDLPAVLDGLHCLSQGAGRGWGEGDVRGVASRVVQNEAGVGVHQEDWCPSSQQRSSAQGVPRVSLRCQQKQLELLRCSYTTAWQEWVLSYVL